MGGAKGSTFGEIRRRITDSIAQTLRIIAGPEQRGVAEALAMLASDRTVGAGYIRTIRDFYARGEAEREAFFRTLEAIEPRKIDYVLNQIYAAMDSPEWLITLRTDLHGIVRRLRAGGGAPEARAPLEELARSFTDYFVKIFNFQYLVTRCCNAQNTSIALLKFISEKEGVHPADNWWDFENRLNSPDHIIVSLEHFKMPYIPLVYVEVALARGLIRKISRIIGERRRPPDLRRADTAVFYSLNTTFDGLAGIALGAKMIIRARDYIRKEYPRIRQFATLSPIPRLGDYLAAVLGGGTHEFLLTKAKVDANKHGRFAAPAEARALRGALGGDGAPLSALLVKALADPAWRERASLRAALRHPLTELTRFYLTREKRIERESGGRLPNAYDPVANFHLSNGASIGSINFLANDSERGMRESFGMMVNYIYDEERQEANKMLYARGGVAAA
ncbi:MAG: malonyl-CoA decarboxylase family protein [bacterium]|nr:malonyl-CoA decarboxylase family protein [bacterium]